MKLPPPKLFPGAPDPWTITEPEYNRWIRTFYVPVDDRHAARISGLLEQSRAYGKELMLSTDPSILRDLSLPEKVTEHMYGLTRLQPQIRVKDITGNEWTRAFDASPAIEIELPEETRVLDLTCALQGGKFFIQPEWWPDFLDWLQEKQDDLVVEEGNVWDPGLHAENADYHNREGTYWSWARDAGYDVVLHHHLTILNMDIPRIVSVIPKLSAPVSHGEIVWNASKTMEVPEIVLAYHYMIFKQRAEASEIEDQARKAEATISLISRLLLDMRQQDHTVKQEIELIHLGIMSCHKLMMQIARIAWMNMAYDKKAIRAIRCFPMPGSEVRGLIRPEGTEGWPDELLSLYMRWHPGMDASEAVQNMRAQFSAFMVDSRTTTMAVEFFAEGIAPVLKAIGWEPGEKFLKDFD